MDACKVLALASVLLAALSSSIPARAQTDSSPGQNLATEVCSECHGVELGNLRSPNPNAPSFQELANTPGMNDMTIRVWLQSPHRSMPLLVLDETEIDDVSDYIMSLKPLSP